MTIDERVEMILKDSSWPAAVFAIAVRAHLQEVARDQRHACAEAVNECKRGSLLPDGEKLIQLDEAHQAAVNAEIK